VKKGFSVVSLGRSKIDYSDNESSEEFSNKDQSPRSDFKRIGRAETISHLNPRHHSRTSSPMGNKNISNNDPTSTGEKNGNDCFCDSHLVNFLGQTTEAKQWENDFSNLLSKFGKLQEENFTLNSYVWWFFGFFFFFF
jgi:hypothetical protein